MADLTNTSVASNYQKFTVANGLPGRTLIVKVVDGNSALTDASLLAIVNYLTTTHGVSGSGDDAFTVAGFGTADGSAFVSGTTDTVYFALTGTGSFTAGDADTGISGVTVSVEAIFG